MPYPPNKGDKVRSYHLLRHLAARHEVLLGSFVDDAEDEPCVATVRQWCAEVMWCGCTRAAPGSPASRAWRAASR
jgi:polysaccharide biosynthesis protein PslH